MQWLKFNPGTQDQKQLESSNSLSAKTDIGFSIDDFYKALLPQLQKDLLNTPLGYILLDADYRMKWFNNQACYWFGLKQHDKDRPLLHFIRLPALAPFLQSSDFHFFIEYGKFRFRLHRIPLLFSFVLLQIESEQDRDSITRMQSEFLASVSHELNTPITVINGFLELLEVQVNQQESQMIIERLRRQTARLSGLSSQLLQLLRTQQKLPRYRNIDALTFFEQLRVETEAMSLEKREISWHIDESLNLYGDSTALHSACRNLIDNAIRYTLPLLGKIAIRWMKNEEKKIFEVADNGIGIASEYLPRLGERFFRAGQETIEGTGLGLSIVKQVVQQHHAEFSVHSELGKGSVFRIEFRTISSNK